MGSFTMDNEHDSLITIKLFRNVTNMSDIRKKVMDNSVKCGVVKPKLIVDPFQIVVAFNKAICCGNQLTKSVYTDMLFNLSISKNISQSLQQFGVHDDDTDILVVVLDEANTTFDYSFVQGNECDLSELSQLTDIALVKKTYKVKEDEYKSEQLIDSVVSRIASKDFVKF